MRVVSGMLVLGVLLLALPMVAQGALPHVCQEANRTKGEVADALWEACLTLPLTNAQRKEVTAARCLLSTEGTDGAAMERHCTAAIRLDPFNFMNYLSRGHGRFLQGKYAGAEGDISMLLSTNGTIAHPYPYRLRGMARAQLGDHRNALKDIDKALEMESFPFLLAFRGAIHLELEQWQEAIADFDAALEDDPVFVLAMEGRLNAQADPEDDQTWLMALKGRAAAQAELGYEAEALKGYTAALSIAPDDALVLNELAWLLVTATDPTIRNAPKALEYATRSVAKAREHYSLDTLAAAYAALGRFDEAIDAIEEAIALAKAGPALQEELAEHERALTLYQAGKPYAPLPKKKR